MMYLPLAAFFVVVIWLITTHNRYVKLENVIPESWSNVEVQLKRRHDLIPNLVETAKGFASHEQEVFDRVTKARAEAMDSLVNAEMAVDSERELAAATQSFFAVAESYPELKSNANFLALQKELASTEDRIAAARRFFNANIRDFNTMLESFPSSLMAGGRTRQAYFDAEEITFSTGLGL